MAMRGPVIACLVATVLAGCTTRQRIAGGGAGLAVIGLGLTFSNESRTEEDAEDTAGKIGIACLLTGLVVLFVAAALDEASQESKAKEIKVTSATETQVIDQKAAAAAQQKRDQALALTKQAQESAAAGDCPKVIEISAQVGALDAKLYAETFLADAAVQACFVPKEAAPEAAPPVPSVVPVAPPVTP
jgi:hypothetical protein